MKPRIWTPARINQIRKMAADGMTVTEIGRHFGKSESVIRHYAGKHDIPLPTIKTGFSEKENAIIREMFGQGYKWQDIADALDRKTSTLSKHANENLGLRIKPKRERQTTTRRCLMCGSGFASEWIGERVCGACKKTEAWQNADHDRAVRI